jgi:hypothetical protein
LSVERCLSTDRQFKDATSCCLDVSQWKATVLSDNYRDRYEPQHELAKAYLEDRIDDAIVALYHVVEVRKRTLNEEDHASLKSEVELARAYLDNRRFEDTISILQCVEIMQKVTFNGEAFVRLMSEHDSPGPITSDLRRSAYSEE